MSAEVIVTKRSVRVCGVMRQTAYVLWRDMYYRDPALFGSQAVVDRHIDLISASLRIPRSQLHVVRSLISPAQA